MYVFMLLEGIRMYWGWWIECRGERGCGEIIICVGVWFFWKCSCLKSSYLYICKEFVSYILKDKFNKLIGLIR